MRTEIVSLLLLIAAPAAARNTTTQITIDGGPTYLVTTPSLGLSSDGTTSFNALRGVSLPAGGALWLGGGALDTLTGPRKGSWFVPLLGYRFALSSFGANLVLQDNVTATLDTLIFSEILLPGFGYRFGDHFTLSARPAYVRLDTSGSATDGHLTMDVGASADGFAVLGDATVCVGPHTSVCVVAQPTAMWMNGPNFALSFGARVVLDPSQ